jgi:nitroimidazol reductase NimA-like FMN-containing flavoprotein (pyridoxamine 5'-phosphate oxidase superfamily)
MSQPLVSRPHFPKGYVESPKAFVPWSRVENRLANEHNYWICTVRPDGRPHAIPMWAIWVNQRIYFDGSPETLHATNIASNPFVSLHLESGDDVVIVEGTASASGKPSTELAVKLAQAYKDKYASKGYSPKVTQWDHGGLYEILPRTVLAWTSFVDDPTKFVLVTEEEQ